MSDYIIRKICSVSVYIKYGSNHSIDLNTDLKISILKPFATFTDPTWCSVVVVGGEYVNMLDAVIKRVEQIMIDIELHMVPEAIFVFLKEEKYPETIFRIESRDTRAPPVVNIVNLQDLIFIIFHTLKLWERT